MTFRECPTLGHMFDFGEHQVILQHQVVVLRIQGCKKLRK